MKKTGKMLSLLISICMLAGSLSAITVNAADSAGSSIVQGSTVTGSVPDVTAVPPIILSTPDPVPSEGWVPPTIPPYDNVIKLDANLAENVLQPGDIGSFSSYDYFGGESWHYKISNPEVVNLDSSITVPLPGDSTAGIQSQTGFAAPSMVYYSTWYFKALNQGTATIVFYEDNIYTLTGTAGSSGSMPAFNTIIINIRVGDPLPSTPTPSPYPTVPPKPTPPVPYDYVPLDPADTTVLSVGSIGVVKQDYNSNYVWSYEIDDKSVIDAMQYIIMADGQVVPVKDGSATAPSIYPYPGPWYFTALKEGEATITFTGNPVNPEMGMPSTHVIYKVKVMPSGDVTIKPSQPPEPTPPVPPETSPVPTAPNYVPLDSSITNILNVGSIGVVKSDNYDYLWSYDIGDRSIIDCLQIMPMGFGTAGPDGSVSSILPYRGPWFFTALKEGETTITFIGNPSDPNMKLPSMIEVYKVKVTSSGETTIEPTDGTQVTPEPKPLPQPVFTDSQGYEWAMDAVTNLAACGVINGYEDDTFKPGNNVTRAEFAKMLVMTFGIYDPNAVSAFSDVPADAWYNSYIASAEQAGLAKGTGDGSFAPDSTITREEMFTFCARAIEKYKGYNVLDKASPEIQVQANSFVDGDKIDDWALPYVATVTKCGLVTGSPSATGNGNEINPQAPITRAEVAVVLNRALGLK